MTRQVWVINSSGLPGPAETDATQRRAKPRGPAPTPERRFGLRSRAKKPEPQPSLSSPTDGDWAVGWEGISAAPDGPHLQQDVAPVRTVPEVEWFDAEPAWLDPNGPREAQGRDPSWTIYRGTLVGGPLRWLIRRGVGADSQWAFLSVSGNPSADEFALQIGDVAGSEVAHGLIEAIRTTMPDCMSDK